MSKRLVFCFCSFCVVAMLLSARLYSLATDQGLAQTAVEQSIYSLEFNKTRAQIYDCKLNLLTETEAKKILACMPTKKNKEIMEQKKLGTKEQREGQKPFLAQGEVQEEASGLTQLQVPIRSESDALAPHIIGYLDQEGNGVCGIEKAFNEYLKEGSRASKISYSVDSRQNPLAGITPTLSYAPILPNGVVLTIDARIQQIVEEIGGRLLKKGAVVVMEPSTGKLKACASFPEYKTNKLKEAIKDEENAPLLNRAFCAYSVGSTFKIVTAATALSQGISTQELHTCNGAIDVFGQSFSCHQKSGHGELNMQRAMEVSCNPYFINLGLKLDKQRLINMASDLSFGKSVELAPGMATVAGVLPTLAELYNPADIGNLSFGQGILSATPIQIAQMVCAVANGGKTPTAQLIEGKTLGGGVVDNKNEVLPPVIAFDKKTADILKKQLISSVMDTPSQNAKPQYISAAGKTGTAQTGQIKENGDELLMGWFAGFFPADNPKYAIAVLCEDAKSGNQDASPVFAQIADALYSPIYYKGE